MRTLRRGREGIPIALKQAAHESRRGGICCAKPALPDANGRPKLDALTRSQRDLYYFGRRPKSARHPPPHSSFDREVIHARPRDLTRSQPTNRQTISRRDDLARHHDQRGSGHPESERGEDDSNRAQGRGEHRECKAEHHENRDPGPLRSAHSHTQPAVLVRHVTGLPFCRGNNELRNRFTAWRIHCEAV